jgi:hypothetical protein
VILVGKAQEKTPVFRTEKRRNAETGAVYPWIVKTTAMVNHVYFSAGAVFPTWSMTAFGTQRYAGTRDAGSDAYVINRRT